MLPLLKGVVLHLVQDPVDGKFRVDGRGFDGRSDLAHNEVIVVNFNAAVQQHILKSIGHFELFGQVLVLLIALGDEEQALYIHIITTVQKSLAQLVDAGVGRPVLVVDLIAQAVNFIVRLGAACGGVDSCHGCSSLV